MAQSNPIIGITDEVALDHAQQIPDAERFITDGLDIWRGMHPELGYVAVIVGSFGKSIVLPLGNSQPQSA